MKYMIAAIVMAFCPMAHGAACLFGETTQELAEAFAVRLQEELTPEQIRTADRDTQIQIIKATKTRNLAAAMAAVRHSEDGTVNVKHFTGATLPADFYTMITYYPGGNEYGAIFEVERSYPVARIGDGDIYDCRVN